MFVSVALVENDSRWWKEKRETVPVRGCLARVSRDLARRSGRILFFFRVEAAGLHFAGAPGGHAVAGGICAPPRDWMMIAPGPAADRSTFNGRGPAGSGGADDAIHRISAHVCRGAAATAISLGFAAVLAVGIALTLRRPLGLRVLRFVTLVPGGTGGWRRCCAGRPVSGCHALRAAAGPGDQPRGQPISPAGDSAPFARDRIWPPLLSRSEDCCVTKLGQVPAGEHLLITPEGWQKEHREVDARPASDICGKLRGAGHGLLLGGGKAAISSSN